MHTKNEKIAKAMRAMVRARNLLARKELAVAREIGGLPARLASLSAVAHRAAVDCIQESPDDYAAPNEVAKRLQEFAQRASALSNDARAFAIELIDVTLEPDLPEGLDTELVGEPDVHDPADARPMSTPPMSEVGDDDDGPPDEDEEDEPDDDGAAEELGDEPEDDGELERDDTTPGELPRELLELEARSHEPSERVMPAAPPRRQARGNAEELERGIVPPSIDPALLANA